MGKGFFVDGELMLVLTILTSFRWARWTEILELGQFKRGWREQDVEDCARVIVSIVGSFLLAVLVSP